LIINFSYPGKIAELLHRTNAYVPVGVAALLKEKPNLISPAVLAFCNRDPIDMKVRSFISYIISCTELSVPC